MGTKSYLSAELLKGFWEVWTHPLTADRISNSKIVDRNNPSVITVALQTVVTTYGDTVRQRRNIPSVHMCDQGEGRAL